MGILWISMTTPWPLHDPGRRFGPAECAGKGCFAPWIPKLGVWWPAGVRRRSRLPTSKAQALKSRARILCMIIYKNIIYIYVCIFIIKTSKLTTVASKYVMWNMWRINMCEELLFEQCHQLFFDLILVAVPCHDYCNSPTFKDKSWSFTAQDLWIRSRMPMSL